MTGWAMDSKARAADLIPRPRGAFPSRGGGSRIRWIRLGRLLALVFVLYILLATGPLLAGLASYEPRGFPSSSSSSPSPPLSSFCEAAAGPEGSQPNPSMAPSSRWTRWLAGLLLAASHLRSAAGAPVSSDSLLNAQRRCDDEKGAVASESVECSEIGRDLLARGGNAVDALVGTTFCVGVVGMYHSGIGGGGFMLVRDGRGNYEAVDFRETAPAAAFQDMYKSDINLSILGGLAVGIPGEVRGLEYVHSKYGALPWKCVMEGAIKLAREGFTVSDDLVRYMASSISGGRNFLVEDPVWAEDFAPNGALLEVGDIITRKRYANTLEKIANGGAKAFYEGELAAGMVSLIQKTNGSMTLQDLKSYNITSKPPLTTTFRGYKLSGVGAPASGAVCLSTLKTMEQYPRADLADAALSTHRFDEAMRFAYGARQQLGDPDFVDDITPLQRLMLRDSMAKEIRGRILDNTTQPVQNYDPEMVYGSEGHGTSHVVTVDRSGMATSLTTTINLLFGAQIMVADSGIILNNEMNDFSVPGVRNEFGYEPSVANYIRPGKRPLSSITPVIVELPNGTVFATVGAAGGSRIISSTTQVLWRVLDHGLGMRAALAHPRLHDQLMPNVATFEWAFDNATVASMVAKGHNVTRTTSIGSAVQGIGRFANGSFEPASEPRQKNSAGLVAR